MNAPACPSCGRTLDTHHRNVRFTLPDPVIDLPGQERTPGTWMTHPTARESVMMQIPGYGAFVRALLPVHLTGGDSITFGVWLTIDPRQLPRSSTYGPHRSTGTYDLLSTAPIAGGSAT